MCIHVICRFGAEIVAVVAEEAFRHLYARVARLTMPDILITHNVALMESVVPDAEKIGQKIRAVTQF